MRIEARAMLWAIVFVATVAGAAWAIGHFSGGYERFLELAAGIAPAQWGAIAAAAFVFYSLDYARLGTLMALLGVRVGPALGARLSCVTYFISSLTPTAELNVPAMILMLRSRGIAASITTAATLVKAIYMTMWLCVFGFAAIFFGGVGLPPAIADHLLPLVAPAALILAAFFFVMFAPRRALALGERWVARSTAGGWRRSLAAGVNRCVAAIARIGASRHGWHAASHAACIASIVAYAVVGSLLCHAVGIAMPAERALAVFSASLLVAYLAPVPGGIGVSEVLTSYFIDPAMSGEGMVVATLLRFVCSYALVVPGALVLADEVRVAGWRALTQPSERP
ncbi:hypothetical protein BWI17_14010 [Betaproteobacteria bacterium GR16-43]|nr:hypothetical protein BWI17_14010 [Betaproteobacteria bacterium GR16-43]